MLSGIVPVRLLPLTSLTTIKDKVMTYQKVKLKHEREMSRYHLQVPQTGELAHVRRQRPSQHIPT